MNEFHKQAAITGLKKMFKSKYFSIGVVQEACTIAGVHLNEKDMAAMRALHCVDFADMSDDLKKMLFAKVMEVLSAEQSFNIELLSSALDGGRTGFYGGLLN